MVNSRRQYETVQCVIVYALFCACYQISESAFPSGLSWSVEVTNSQFPGYKMAKYLKSIFHTTDRRSNSYEEEGEEEKSTDSPPMDGRRQLSISRSGRMRQANKKRHSLTLELYGDTIQIDAVEKPKSVEYHVNNMKQVNPMSFDVNENNRLDEDSDIEILPPDNAADGSTFHVNLEKKLNALAVANGSKSPEEEIDHAFEIIDKS